MDIKNDNYSRFKYYGLWESRKNVPYNYERDGLLSKILSHKIAKSTNIPLQIILQYYEKSLIFLMKYTDRLRYFKNPHRNNR